MDKRRIIIDANVALSAAIWPQSTPRQVMDATLTHTPLMSQGIWSELEEVFQRSKFDRYVALVLRLAFLEVFLRKCEDCEIVEPIAVCRDPKDDKYLELAVSGRADCIVTGDADLLALHPFRGVPILSPRDFLEWIAVNTTH